VCLIADLWDLMLCHAWELIPVSFNARNWREISLIYFTLSTLLLSCWFYRSPWKIGPNPLWITLIRITHSSCHALSSCVLYTLSLFLVRMIGESERLILHVQHKWKKNLTRCLIDFSPTVRFTCIVYKSLISLEDYRTHDNASFHNLAPPPMSFSSHLPT
jgi:hypothetical protein